jgi:hypothetical protein
MKKITILCTVLVLAAAFTGYGQSADGEGPGVFITGRDGDKPCYWLNGVRYDLGTNGSASAIAVAGSNVYIAGSEGNKPCYWLNGKLQVLPLSWDWDFVVAGASDIAVVGSDVYVAGSESGEGAVKLDYWLNGKLQAHAGGTGTGGSAIAVAGSDVHIAGRVNRFMPGYWLNGVWYELGTNGGPANDIAVAGSDVYIVGTDGDKPCYWFNGVQQLLPIVGRSGAASAIALSYEALAPQAVEPAQHQDAYKIGDRGPAGGWIFYDKGAYSNGWRYLEAAPAETEFKAEWGAWMKYVNGTSGAIGMGGQNTRTIVSYLRQTGESGTAAQLCNSLVLSGYGGWFLPSEGELEAMYSNLKQKGLGEFSDTTYWSSSQDNSALSYWRDFSGGRRGSISGAKSNSYSVRAVRAF